LRVISAHRLVFIHIPKCAGRSICDLLPLEHDRFETMLQADLQGMGAQPIAGMDPACMTCGQLGRIHTKHLPLAVMRAHFPTLWQSVEQSQSFAMVRDPRDRFISAVIQRLREMKRKSVAEIDDATIAREAELACEWLARHDEVHTLDYIHFSRQAGFLFVDGRQVVKHCFAIENFDDAKAWLRQEFGFAADAARPRNRSVKAVGWLRPVAPALGRAYKAALPARWRAILSPYWARSGLLKPTAAGYGAFRLSPAVESFIEHYYRRDRELHRSIRR
jgi:hypothetical protein